MVLISLDQENKIYRSSTFNHVRRLGKERETRFFKIYKDVNDDFWMEVQSFEANEYDLSYMQIITNSDGDAEYTGQKFFYFNWTIIIFSKR